MTKWPASLVRLYLGQMTIQAVLAETGDGDAKTNSAQVCEANFYGGEWALQRGAKDQAVRQLRLARRAPPEI